MKKLLILVVMLFLVGCSNSKDLVKNYNEDLNNIKSASYIFIYNDNLEQYKPLINQLKNKGLPIYLINSNDLNSNLYNWEQHHNEYDIVVGILDENGNINYYESGNGLDISKLLDEGSYTQNIRNNELILVSQVAQNKIDTKLSNVEIAYFPTLLYVNDGIVIHYKEKIKFYDEIDW
ncbi:hypothetical protein KHQ81_15500 (plasmid) [Mycoplasmatota bacterium]|nr:hypothetical protein KHQ81_15500 [Mycoplasmatota bacterium]